MYINSLFQHTAARRRLGASNEQISNAIQFQHTAARRRLGLASCLSVFVRCFNTQPPEGGWPFLTAHTIRSLPVSTHSRPKAAGFIQAAFVFTGGFNTQPPEGGWTLTVCTNITSVWFQHTAARRRLANSLALSSSGKMFQHTAARRRLETQHNQSLFQYSVSTHSRPKAAGMPDSPFGNGDGVSTHSRPKAAGLVGLLGLAGIPVSTHSRPKAAGREAYNRFFFKCVSTHSRPKAAGSVFVRIPSTAWRFNTQPPEGGWNRFCPVCAGYGCFNTQPPEGGWKIIKPEYNGTLWFQHTAARRRLVNQESAKPPLL